jgi:hypothetical protein
MNINSLFARLAALAWLGNLLLLSAPLQQKMLGSQAIKADDEPVIAELLAGGKVRYIFQPTVIEGDVAAQ